DRFGSALQRKTKDRSIAPATDAHRRLGIGQIRTIERARKISQKPRRNFGIVHRRRSPVLANESAAAQSTLTLAALIIGHHFAISAFCQAPSACGVSLSFGGICSPRFSSCLRTAGSFRASTAAALSFATTSFGVSLGTQRPDHNVM